MAPVSSLTGSNSFRLNCCYYKNAAYRILIQNSDTDFRYRNLYTDIEYLVKLERVERDFSFARQDHVPTQQEVVTEGRDLCLSSRKVS